MHGYRNFLNIDRDVQDKTSEGSEFQLLIVSGKKDPWNCRVLLLGTTSCLGFR